MKNQIIKDALASKKMYQYQLADILGVNEGTVCRMFRHELPEDKQKEIVRLIESAPVEN